MARSPMELPTGVEIRNGAIRIRFTQSGKRCSETLPYPATQQGIQTASRLRDQVVSLNKLGLLDQAKYAELFPNSATTNQALENTFGVYAQMWLDSKNIVKGTRLNYRASLNKWLMPYLATKHLTELTPAYLRKLTAEIPWTNPQVKLGVLVKLSTILGSAVDDEILIKNPMDKLELPKKATQQIDPFTQQEANRIITAMYEDPDWRMRIYAAYIEFAFYTGMRPGEIAALRWEEVDTTKRTAHVCRIVVGTEVAERTKTGKHRVVLLNARALHALEYARQYIKDRQALKGKITDFPYCFPPARNSSYIRDTNRLHRGWRDLLATLGIAYKPPYNARHTYATICLMSGMAPAFIAKQLGHSVKILLSTYAHWLSGEDDWNQLDKLNMVQDCPK